MNNLKNLAVLFTCIATLTAEASDLKALKECQGFDNIPAVKDADKKVYGAINDQKNSFTACSNLQSTCEEYAKDPQQDLNTIQQISKDSQTAAKMGKYARESTDDAISALKKDMNPLNTLGVQTCAQAMVEKANQLQKDLATIETKCNKLKDCAKK